MRRRTLVSALLVPAMLAGCGFELRQAPHYAFSSIYVNTPERSPLGAELRRTLGSSGLTVITESTRQASAQVILDSLVDQREKVVVGLNVAGQVRTFQLRTRFTFRLRTPGGKDLIPQTEILVTRDTSFTESQALAKDSEDVILYKDMQSDVVQQLMRRLASVKSI